MAATVNKLASAANGRFQALTMIGSGGMGLIYGATDTWTRRPVALKLPRPARTGLKRTNAQLEREALNMALADDQNVCSLYDLTAHSGRACMVMERLRGESLQARLLRGRMGPPELLVIAIQVASALTKIHSVGLVHQDVKPANVFLGKPVVKVLDFGIATWIGAPSEGGVAAKGAAPGPVVGSANYVSPERLLRRPADPRSDLFSFGVVLYEMATGQLPFAAASPMERILNILEARPLPMGSLAPEHPPALARIVHRLLSRSLADRYQSAGELQQALREVLLQAPAARGRAHQVH